MKRLVVNADDFGLSQGVNLGVLRAHQHGILTSATLMVTMPAAAEAFTMAKATPSLGVGIHITLTAGRPLSGEVPSLTGPDGRFLRLPDLASRAQRADVEREVTAQVEAFLAAGLRPTHLDSHHHVHLEIRLVADVFAAAAARLGVPVRGIGRAPALIDRFYGREQVTVERLLALLSALTAGSTSEIMAHPAYLDPALLDLSSYTIERVHELAALTATAVQEAVRAQAIALISYRDL